MGIRFFPVDNYLVFYLPNETEGIEILSALCMVGGIFGNSLAIP